MPLRTSGGDIRSKPISLNVTPKHTHRHALTASHPVSHDLSDKEVQTQVFSECVVSSLAAPQTKIYHSFKRFTLIYELISQMEYLRGKI